MKSVLVYYELSDGFPSVVGPFENIYYAQKVSEGIRRDLELPAEATPENNEAWTEAGWYFGIVPMISP